MVRRLLSEATGSFKSAATTQSGGNPPDADEGNKKVGGDRSSILSGTTAAGSGFTARSTRRSSIRSNITVADTVPTTQAASVRPSDATRAGRKSIFSRIVKSLFPDDGSRQSELDGPEKVGFIPAPSDALIQRFDDENNLKTDPSIKLEHMRDEGGPLGIKDQTQIPLDASLESVVVRCTFNVRWEGLAASDGPHRVKIDLKEAMNAQAAKECSQLTDYSWELYFISGSIPVNDYLKRSDMWENGAVFNVGTGSSFRWAFNTWEVNLRWKRANRTPKFVTLFRAVVYEGGETGKPKLSIQPPELQKQLVFCSLIE